MRLAYVTDGMFPAAMGGMGKFSRYLLEELLKKDIEVDLFLREPVADSPEGAQKEIERLGVGNTYWLSWPEVPKYPGHYTRENWIFSKEVASWISSGNYQVVYAHGLTAWALVQGTHGVKVISNLHGFEPFQELSSWKEQLRSALLRWPIREIAKSSNCTISFGAFFTSLLRTRIGVAEDQIAEIPNAVSEEFLEKAEAVRVNRTSNARPKFIFVGRHEKRKGLPLFLKMAQVFETCDFEVVGEIPEGIQREFGQRSNVFFRGPVWDKEELIRVYVAADALILPSYAEGMPTVVLEAMAAGLPVLASRVGTCPEMLEGGAGILFEPGHKSDLKRAVETFLGFSDEERERMVQLSLERIRSKYTWSIVGEQTFQLMKSL